MAELVTKWNSAFWTATAERVGSTFLMSYFGIWLGGDVALDVFEFNWFLALGPALTASLLSLVKCVLANNVGLTGPSLANEVLTGRHRARRDLEPPH
jgi:hypothetical protein